MIERRLLQLRFVLQLRLVLKAIIAGQAADQLAALPVVEDAADIFAGDAGHRSNVALSDLLADDDATRADVLAEMLRKLEQGRGNAAFERQETPGRDHRVGLAQTHGEQRDQGLVDLGIFLRESLERGAAEKALVLKSYGDD